MYWDGDYTWWIGKDAGQTGRYLKCHPGVCRRLLSQEKINSPCPRQVIICTTDVTSSDLTCNRATLCSGKAVFLSQQQHTCLTSKLFRPVLGPIQPPVPMAPGYFPVVNRRERDADHSHLAHRSRMNGSIPLLPPQAFIAWTFKFTLTASSRTHWHLNTRRKATGASF